MDLFEKLNMTKKKKEKKISDTSRLFKETNYNAKVPANSTLILVENEIPDVSNCRQNRL